LKNIKKIAIGVFVSLLLVGICAFSFIPTETLQIRIFAHLKVNAAQLNIHAGNYKVVADGNLVSESTSESVYKIVLHGDSIELDENDKKLGVFRNVKFSGDEFSELKLKLLNPDRKVRTYQNNIAFSVSEGYIRMLNDVILDNYIRE
jgi:hypothetical protein